MESFGLPIQLTVIEVPPMVAEYGAGGAFATEAPEFVDVELPVSGQGYRIDLPVRGNPNLIYPGQELTIPGA